MSSPGAAAPSEAAAPRAASPGPAVPGVPPAMAGAPSAEGPVPARTGRSWPGRVGTYLVTVFVLVSLNFFLPRMAPGDPVSRILDARESGAADEPTRAALARYYGLDRPLWAQYGHYLGTLARGDLGVSTRYSVPVADLVAERLPWTILLAGTATVVSMALGLVAGVHSGWRRGRRADRVLLGAFFGLRIVPTFFLASMALFLFAVRLDWVPLGGATTPFSSSFGIMERVGDIVHHLALPAAVLAVQFSAGYYLIMRAGMVRELGADYLLLGRAKGLADHRLKYAYAARNAVLPVVTLTTLELAFAVTGSIFVERLFAYPGMGRLTFDALEVRDYPALQGCFLVFTLSVVSLNALTEALYPRLDPRVRP